MAERFYEGVLAEYESYETMGVDEDLLRGLYPGKDNREFFLRHVRGLFTSKQVSYEEAGDLLRLGEETGDNPSMNADGTLVSGTIYEGLKQVTTLSVEERQKLRAELFAAASAGV